MLIKASLLTVQFTLIWYNEYIDLGTIQMKINDHYPLQVGRAQWTYGSKQLSMIMIKK